MKIEAGTLISPACGSMCFIKPCRNLRQKHSRFPEIFQRRPVQMFSCMALEKSEIHASRIRVIDRRPLSRKIRKYDKPF